jgi:hypothetical protein
MDYYTHMNEALRWESKFEKPKKAVEGWDTLDWWQNSETLELPSDIDLMKYYRIDPTHYDAIHGDNFNIPFEMIRFNETYEETVFKLI